MKLIPLAAALILTATPITAQETPEAAPEPSTIATPRVPAADPSVIHVADNPDQIIRLRTRVRHTTVIQLPGRENILDFVVGDSEYWHLDWSGPISPFLETHFSEGVNTNVALVCESGRIYSFLVSEQPGQPHLVVRIASAAESVPRISPTIHQPAFVARDQVAGYQQMAEQARQTAVAAQTQAEQQIAGGPAAGRRRDQFLPSRLSHAHKVSLPARRQGAQVGRSWCKGCGTTDNSPTCAPTLRSRRHYMRSKTGNRRW